jgi:hypothetical protein
LHAFDYLDDRSFPTLLEYLRHPVVEYAFKKKCLEISDIDFVSEWARYEKDPEILLELSKNKDESILLSIAANPSASVEVLIKILDEKDLDLDFAVSIRESLPIELIKILISSSFAAVRKEIAQRPDLEYRDYEILATDSSMLVRDAIKENDRCPVEIKALAALGSL